MRFKVPRTIVCQECGQAVEAYTHNRRYCDQCRESVQQQNVASWEREHPGRTKAWDAANPERRQAIETRSIAKTIERRRSRSRAWWRANKNRALERQKQYRRLNPDLFAGYDRARRARELGAEGSHTSEEFKALVVAFGNRCAYCLEAMGVVTEDHMTPLSRGGSDELANIVPCCKRCNSRKRARTLLEFAVVQLAEVA